LDRAQRAGRIGYEAVSMSRVQYRDRRWDAAHRGVAGYAWSAFFVRGRGASALAHRLLAAAAVTARPLEDGLFSTQLGTAGPRVAFLHGLFGQGKNWTTIAKGLSGSARVSLVDLPNHGRSPWTDHFSYADMARLVADLLRAEGGPEQWAVVGHSMGGKVAMTLALLHRDLVERLCVVDVSPVPTRQTGEFATFVRGMRAINLETLTDRKVADTQLAGYVSDPAIRSFLLQNLRRESSPSGAGWRWQMNLELLGAHLDEVGAWPEPDVQPYEGPVLWLGGATSRYIRPEYAVAMRALFPRTQLVTIKGAGHWVHSEQPQVFLATMRRFLGL
jgi:esterase